MKKNILVTVMFLVAVALVLGLYFTGDSSAQVATQPINPAVRPDIKKIPKICMKADLGPWDNYKLMPKDEFPYSGSCKACWEQAGIMNLPTMSVWIMNTGKADAPACKAKLTFASGKPPYQNLSITANVPALKAGEKHLLTVTAPYNNGKPQYLYQTAKPITLELDSAKQVDECSESNNTFTYNYPG
jgi:hypothetical protein